MTARQTRSPDAGGRATDSRDAARRVVDQALAGVLRRLAPETDAAVLRGAELAARAVALGHAALDLRRPQLLGIDDADAPDPDAWRRALQASRWVAEPDPDAPARADAPLVLEGDLLYLRRYREYERRLAAGLWRIARQDVAAGDLDALAPLYLQLFPQAREGDLQARAAALALVRKLLLISGGPGTGKTTTIARLLVLLAAQRRARGAAPPLVALAAPTGRAAERMAQGLREAVQVLRAQGIDPALCEALPTEARTLHRLLGVQGDSPRFRHGADQPLAHDVVVVDEASMVDLPLMCKLVEAVADGAALVLLGDPDQLPSVEAGDVLAAICSAAGTRAPMPDALAGLIGDAPPAHAGLDDASSGATTSAAIARPVGETGDLFAAPAPPPTAPPADGDAPLAGHRVHLQRGYRQSADLELAPLADAVRAGDAALALALLRAGTLAGVRFHHDLADPLAASARDALLAPWRALAAATDPAEALRQAARQRLLTALRGGPQGAAMLNARIEEALAGAQRDAYFHGRMLLVTENSYRHGLFNGDIGVCLRDAGGAMVAWFAGGDGVRGFHPAALPAHAGAFAMTVHKAQGSEFDTAWLLLPRRDNRVLSRELVYTALTRARRELHLCAGEAVLHSALARHAQRVSGLAARLHATRP